MIIGVPVGAHTDVLDWHNRGCPFDNTRVVPVIQVPVTQGPFAAGGGGNAQPAIAYTEVTSTLGAPPRSTRGFGTVGVACPPCEHVTVAPTCNKNPGIPTLLQVMARAPLLMVTVGPTIVIVAPLPLLM
jgi:hypothetical protein